MAGGSVHDVAKVGFGTGTNELYDKARPSYQSAPIAHIRKSLSASEPLDIVEIGAGTGIFTRALLAHPDWSSSIGKLTAVEPSEGMRDAFSKSSLAHDPRVSTQDGSFDHTNVSDGQADLIAIAQAFHWCPDHAAASREFARVLKPGGSVALIWNLEDRDGAEWVAQLRDTYEVHEAGTPQFRLGLWRKLFDEPAYKELFHPPEENVWEYTLPGRLDIVTNRVFSKSFITILPPEEKTQLEGQIREIVTRGDGKKWIDESQGIFEYPYKTWVVILRRK